MSFRALLLVALLAGCADPYETAKKANTIEAYEKFLSDNPDSKHKQEAEDQLEQLSFDQAKTTNTIEAWDAFLDKFPKSKLKAKAMDARKPLVLDQAEAEDTPEAWQKVLDTYGKTDRKLMLTARRHLAISKEKDKIGIGAVTSSQVNVEGDAKGQPDGWKFTADVTNKGTLPMQELVMSLDFLGADGKPVDTREWPAVAKRLPQNTPLPAGFDTPIAVGETRSWSFTIKNPPKDWDNKSVVLKAAAVRWLQPDAGTTGPTVAGAEGKTTTATGAKATATVNGKTMTATTNAGGKVTATPGKTTAAPH